MSIVEIVLTNEQLILFKYSIWCYVLEVQLCEIVFYRDLMKTNPKRVDSTLLVITCLLWFLGILKSQASSLGPQVSHISI